MQARPSPDSGKIKFSGSVAVGKDILELLSSAMYVDPLAIYREFIQNAADSIDEATVAGHYGKGAAPAVQIRINPADRSATVRDNGAGISQPAFSRTLTAVGASKKRLAAARGFRGVGRLAGLGYCQQLIMRSKTTLDSQVSAMHWDCRKLKELLREPLDLSLEQMIAEVVTTDSLPAKGFPEHFFEVEMQQVIRHKNDLLLNPAALEQYLGQIAPVPFSPHFSSGPAIQDFLGKHSAWNVYNISINERPVFRPYRDTYEVKPGVHGRFSDIEFLEVQGVSGGIDAVGWILHSEYLGAIPERHSMQGIRLRVGNMQIGEPRLLDTVFPEPRFNAWAVGECHVLSRKITPNARRDDFEQNTHYTNLLNQLAPRAKNIARACRERSAERARLRAAKTTPGSGNGYGFDWASAKIFLAKNAQKRISQPHKRSIQTVLKSRAPTYASMIAAIITNGSATNGKTSNRR